MHNLNQKRQNTWVPSEFCFFILHNCLAKNSTSFNLQFLVYLKEESWLFGKKKKISISGSATIEIHGPLDKSVERGGIQFPYP